MNIKVSMNELHIKVSMNELHIQVSMNELHIQVSMNELCFVNIPGNKLSKNDAPGGTRRHYAVTPKAET